MWPWQISYISLIKNLVYVVLPASSKLRPQPMIEEHTYSTDITARCNDKDRPSALTIKIIGDRGSHFHSYLNL